MISMFKKIFILFAIFTSLLYSSVLHFKKYNLKGEKKGNTLLVIGGIHGNEPGAYFAPAMLIKHYKILKGNLMVIPNLNFDSDIRNERGAYGDMNRKFVHISKKDPDFHIIRDIKKIILSKKIDLILNLHDGHGFYRKKWQSHIFNPKAWGQALIIDQMVIPSQKYKELGKICNSIADKINNSVFNKVHMFRVKNTKTKLHDKQMRLSLTYFAITHHKPALAIETSKNITDLAKKVYYQLLTIEAFMKVMGIEYKRDFRLNERSVRSIINQFGTLKINNRLKINLNRIKKYINYIPLDKKSNDFIFSHPLGAVIRYKNIYYIHIGNKTIAKIRGEYFKLSKIHPKLKIKTKNSVIDISKAFKVDIKGEFKILAPKDIRVNVIGYTSKKYKNEANIWIKLSQINKKYTIYKNSNVYRVEFYDKYNRYIKTVLIKFQ